MTRLKRYIHITALTIFMTPKRMDAMHVNYRFWMNLLLILFLILITTFALSN